MLTYQDGTTKIVDLGQKCSGLLRDPMGVRGACPWDRERRTEGVILTNEEFRVPPYGVRYRSVDILFLYCLPFAHQT